MGIKTATFKEGDKFILEIGKRKLDKYEIAGTDYFIKISLLEKLVPYKPKENTKEEGKWINNTYCSECGWANQVEPGFIVPVEGFNFCPNCGASMEDLINVRSNK